VGTHPAAYLSGHASSMRRALVAAAASSRRKWRMYLRVKRIDASCSAAPGYIALLAQPNWRELAW
jgi:hypothetical protein